MNGKHQLEGTQEWGLAADKMGRPAKQQRLKHVAWAAAFSLILFLVSLLDPIDQLVWTFQSRTVASEASNDIVFVGAEMDLTDPLADQRRTQLARVLRDLDRRGAEKIYIDMAFDRPSEPASDAALARAISDLDDRVALVGHLDKGFDGNSEWIQTVPQIAGNAEQLTNSDHSQYFGIAWSVPRSESYKGVQYQALGSALAGEKLVTDEPISIAYNVPITDIASARFSNVVTAIGDNSQLSGIAGKKVIIGSGREAATATSGIPGQRDVPLSYIAIYAAETIQQGGVTRVEGWVMLAFLLATLIALASISAAATLRRAGYALVALSIPGFLTVCTIYNLRPVASYAIVALVIYAAQRLRILWQDWASLKDQDTGLPTLRAFERNLIKNGSDGFVVVAKIHDFGRVLKLLPGSLQSTYVLKIADRLRASEPDLDLHFANHYFAWLSKAEDFGALEEHLEGLRALFAAPLHIAGNQIDVGITFGVAQAVGENLRSLPAAIAAAEETSEALCPIKLAEHADTRDGLWDISMRARIDAAMETGEIYCVYQPKVAVETGKAKGVEALVRWDDPERGSIPPLHFIQECEKAGRMEHLTRYVLQSACTAGRLLHSNGHRISMSVNISATLCSDASVVEMVRNALQATKFPAHFLVLEITETARIRDLLKAAAIIKQIKALGVRISMDDFGVGEANFETFYELPFDELKIDRLFIKNITADAKARAIATSLIAMGNEARITVVAEGVEEIEDLAILREIGCSEVQGFALSRPISLSNLLIYLSEGSHESLTNVV
ncbi:MAG: EAL domain-containing protein [Erythrobacter sp.]